MICSIVKQAKLQCFSRSSAAEENPRKFHWFKKLPGLAAAAAVRIYPKVIHKREKGLR
jgi:hypothetical protein